jgi:acyl carrier protein
MDVDTTTLTTKQTSSQPQGGTTMEKPEILKMLVKNLKQVVPDVDESKIDVKKSMMEVGANSLDVVDVVSTTMRELKVKIPRESLGKLKNVGDLVDALHDAQTK